MNAIQTATVAAAKAESPEQVIEINNLRKGFGTAGSIKKCVVTTF